jgi:hypothetical protein
MALTTLQAVNEMLEYLGDPAVTALDATTDATEAEAFLDRWRRRVLAEQAWPNLKEEEFELTIPDRLLTVGSVTSGPYTYNETVTETGSAATGTFAYIDSTSLYLRNVSGTFAGNNTLTGGTSGATCTGSAVSTETSGRIPVDPLGWLRVTRDRSREWKDVVPRAGFFYDIEEQSSTFTTSVFVDLVLLDALGDLPDMLAQYVVAKSAWAFQEYKQRAVTDEAMIEKRLAQAQGHARQEALRIRTRNPLTTVDMRKVKGDRTQLMPMGLAGWNR